MGDGKATLPTLAEAQAWTAEGVRRYDAIIHEVVREAIEDAGNGLARQAAVVTIPGPRDGAPVNGDAVFRMERRLTAEGFRVRHSGAYRFEISWPGPDDEAMMEWVERELGVTE